STLVFWKDLLRHLNDTKDLTDETNEIEMEPVVEVPLPFEQRGCPIVDLGPNLDFIPDNGWQGDYPAHENEELNTVVHINQFEGDALKKLVKRAKLEGVSVHSAIYTAYLLAWVTHYQGRTVKTATAINCRPFCVPAVGDELGVFFGRFECGWDEITLALHAANDFASFWDLAREYHKRLQSKKQETCQRTLMMDSLLKTFPESYCDVWTSARKKYLMGRSGGLNISDLGRFDVDQEGNAWTMKEMWFCQSTHSFATAIALNVITACGKLDVAFTWQQGAVVDHKAEAVIRSFLKILSNQAI
ncbi:alcohol acetyltransferase-domain-containing protein, partial [Gongronella butleri]